MKIPNQRQEVSYDWLFLPGFGERAPVVDMSLLAAWEDDIFE